MSFPPDDWRGTVEQWETHEKATIAAAERARELRAQIARRDPNTFCRFVLRDEETGKPVHQAPVHQRWHELAAKHDRLLLWSAVEHGKTSQLAVGRTLWELGRDPSLRFVIASGTHKMAVKISATIARYIEKSLELHEVFPGLVKTTDTTAPWRADALTVERPGLGAKDPSIQVTGPGGNILGSRVDRFVFDDLLNLENTRTQSGRDDTYAWVKYVLGRLSPRGKVIFNGNALHPDDAMHRLRKEGSFACYSFPAVDSDGKVAWPEKWTPDVFERKRIDLGPHEYARLVMCRPRDASESRFKREWIDGCMARGFGIKPTTALERLPPGYSTYTGVDLGARLHDKADLTVFFTMLLHPNGDREVLNIESGRFDGPEIVRRLVDIHRRYDSIVIVESNAAQQFVVDFTAQHSAVPVRSFNTTGANKHNQEFGLESMATELANGKWIIPCLPDGSPQEQAAVMAVARLERSGELQRGLRVDKEIQAWCDEMVAYDPSAHTGDRLMASWIAREGSRGKGKVARAAVRRIDLMSR